MRLWGEEEEITACLYLSSSITSSITIQSSDPKKQREMAHCLTHSLTLPMPLKNFILIYCVISRAESWERVSKTKQQEMLGHGWLNTPRAKRRRRKVKRNDGSPILLHHRRTIMTRQMLPSWILLLPCCVLRHPPTVSFSLILLTLPPFYNSFT